MSENIPTKMEGRANEVNQRIAVIKQLAQKLEKRPETDIGEDEHYWYLVLRAYTDELKTLKKHFQDKEKVRQAALESAVRNAEDMYYLEQKATVDGLTGAWSRRSLDNYLERVRHLRENGSGEIITTGILLMDIDGFKKINDIQGHLAGDNALIELVKILKAKTRGTDMEARYGGDEFALVMPYIPSEKIAIERARDISRTVKEQTGFTVSIGVTSALPGDASIKDIYSRADTALYTAKNAGKSLVGTSNGRV